MQRAPSRRNDMRKIGIMGGTFDPIHVGHLMLAEWAMEEAGLEEVWVVPTGVSYMKAGRSILPGHERLHMAELATRDNARFRCLDIEIRREGYTYTYETLELLKKQNPNTEIFFIVGADCLFAIENWRHPEKIFGTCTLVAAVRNDASMKEMEEKRRYLLEKFGGNIILMPFVRMSVTSTEIRERIRKGKSVRYMVPRETLAYIEEKGFYRDEEDRQHETTEQGNEEGSGQ